LESTNDTNEWVCPNSIEPTISKTNVLHKPVTPDSWQYSFDPKTKVSEKLLGWDIDGDQIWGGIPPDAKGFLDSIMVSISSL
jgi:hypothetical protein